MNPATASQERSVISQQPIGQSAPIPPVTWGPYIVKWGLPYVSLLGYFILVTVPITLPVSVFTEKRSDTLARLKIIGQGAITVAASTGVAVAAKIAEAAKTACFDGWNEAKNKLRQAVGPDGFIRNTLIPFAGLCKRLDIEEDKPVSCCPYTPAVPRILTEGLDIARKASTGQSDDRYN